MIKGKFKVLTLVGVTSLGMVLVQPARAIQLDFANLTLTTLSFDGAGNFGFTPVFANQFRITDSTGVGDSINNLGMMNVMNGSWSIGAVSSPSPGVFTAPVTGTGTLVIHGGGSDLTGALTWDLIETAGTGGTLNLDGVINLTGLSYSGTENDLIQLATEQGGVAEEDLHFHTTKGTTQVTLPQLKSGTTLQTSFAGTITAQGTPPVPDGGSSMVLLGSALLCLEALRRKLSR